MKNIEKYCAVLQAEQLDAILLTSQVSRMYCAEYDIAEGIAVVTPKGSRYFTDSRYIEDAEKNLKGFAVELVDQNRNFLTLIQKAIDDFGIKKMGFEEACLTVADFRTYEEKLNVTFVPCQQAINKLRYVKEDWELEIMKQAQAITDKAFTDVLPKIKAGMTEKELRAELIYCLYKNGADGLAFEPIIVAGPNSSMPHGVPGDRRIQEGDFITMDFGASYKGYCSDMTRTVALGYATDEMKKIYSIVLEAQLAGIAATKAGVTGRSIDLAARKVIEDAGYGDCFGHGYGHSLGLEIHETPNCNLRNDQPMPAGAVTSAEPGIYLPDKFGVRIEDCIVITEDGCIDITASDKNLIIL